MRDERARQKKREKQRKKREHHRRALAEPEVSVTGLQSGLPRMSDVLVDFARPLLDAVGGMAAPAETVQHVLLCAATVWNTTLLQEEGVPGAPRLAETAYALHLTVGLPLPEAERLVAELAAQRLEHFAQERRMAVDVQVVDEGDITRVYALSAPLSP